MTRRGGKAKRSALERERGNARWLDTFGSVTGTPRHRQAGVSVSSGAVRTDAMLRPDAVAWHVAHAEAIATFREGLPDLLPSRDWQARERSVPKAPAGQAAPDTSPEAYALACLRVALHYANLRVLLHAMSIATEPKGTT